MKNSDDKKIYKEIEKMKKIISIIVTLSLILSMTTGVLASEKRGEKITDHEKAIQLIESQFLSVSEESNYVIHKNAQKYIDSTLLQNITESMEGVNELNKKEFVTIISKQDIIVSDTYKNMIISSANEAGYNINEYVVRWYGADIYMDANNSNIMAAQLATISGMGATGTAAVGLAGYFFPPLLIGAGIMGISTGYMATLSGICWQGNATGRGSMLRCYVQRSFGASIPYGAHIPFAGSVQ